MQALGVIDSGVSIHTIGTYTVRNYNRLPRWEGPRSQSLCFSSVGIHTSPISQNSFRSQEVILTLHRTKLRTQGSRSSHNNYCLYQNALSNRFQPLLIFVAAWQSPLCPLTVLVSIRFPQPSCYQTPATSGLG